MNWLIPPKQYQSLGDSVALPAFVRVLAEGLEDETATDQVLAAFSSLGVQRAADSADTPFAIRFHRDDQHAQDAYALSIRSEGIDIAAGTDAGLFYGVQTLRELLRLHGKRLPCLAITDYPDFDRRCCYLDCSRGKVPTVATLKQLIERLASWKLNELQLYVENVFTFQSHPDIGVGYDPFTPDDIAALREFARRHHVRLVPSLASLGHMEKILMLSAHQQLGELPGYRGWPGGTTLSPQEPGAIELVADLYADFLPHFDALDFNVCGDEPWELGQGKSKAAAESKGVGRVYLEFILKLYDLCQQHGKRMNLWGDIVLRHPEILNDLPSDLVMLNWDYDPNGPRMQRTHEFREAGLTFLCCPGTHGWKSHGTRLSQAMQNTHQFAAIARREGASGLMITDWGDAGHRNTLAVSLHTMAYAAACAWNGSETPAPETSIFTERYLLHMFGESSVGQCGAIRAIGDERLGEWAYFAALERLSAPEGFGTGFCQAHPVINDMPLSEDEVAELLHEQASIRIDIDPSGLPTFDQQSVAEYDIARRMNLLALERVHMARRVRVGKSIDTRTLEAHQEAWRALKPIFSENWLARNRPSRLDDNLVGFDQAIAETIS